MRPRPKTRTLLPVEIAAGRVTAITPSPRAAGRFDLVVDGQPVARLSIDGIERLRLRIGLDIGDVQAAAIADEAEVIRAYDRSISMLALRGRASGELRRLLVQKGEAPATVDRAISRLQSAGLLDDAAFARQFTRYRAAGGGMSRRRIERELWRRGVDRATAAAAIDQTFVEEGVDEAAAVEQVAERKFRTLAKLDAPTRRRRLYSFLARRGYDVDAIGAVVRRLTKEGGDRV